MRILLVDDEAELAEPLSRVLTRQGYQVDIATDGQAGSQLAASASYDLLILDWMLPHYSGLEICQQVRSRGDATPVLFLTAKDTLNDRVEGLDAGADDYPIIFVSRTPSNVLLECFPWEVPRMSSSWRGCSPTPAPVVAEPCELHTLRYCSSLSLEAHMLRCFVESHEIMTITYMSAS